MTKKTNKDALIEVSNAGPLVRLAAFLYDSLLMLAMWMAVSGPFVADNGG